jgi:hypothetical protein
MENVIRISVSEFTETPGSRYKIEGPFSGEEYRDSIVEPKFLEAEGSQKKLLVNLDGPLGYGTSFLEEVFGGLARKYGAKRVLDGINFISEEEPYLIDDIQKYVEDTEK